MQQNKKKPLRLLPGPRRRPALRGAGSTLR